MIKFSVKNVIILMIIATATIVFFLGSTPVVNQSLIKTISLIDYPSKFNYRQTANDCGPYNTAAVVRALKKTEVDSQAFAEEVGWRLPNKYTLPWGLEEQLEKNGITIEKPNLRFLSDEKKILFLQQELSQEKPIIILGERSYFEHYVTIFGFDSSKDEFYIYDSLGEADEDDNFNLPGNKTFSSEELLNFWRKGGMYGLYEWYAIVASVG